MEDVRRRIRLDPLGAVGRIVSICGGSFVGTHAGRVRSAHRSDAGVSQVWPDGGLRVVMEADDERQAEDPA